MGYLDQVVQWVGLALLLFVCPVLVTQFMMRDRAKWNPKRFWIFACFAVFLSLLFVWYHELHHWFRHDVRRDTERLIFGAIIMAPVLLALVSMIRWASSKWLSGQSRRFQFCLGGIYVALMAFGVIWLLDKEGQKLLDFDGFLECSLVGLGIYIAISLLWNMVGRISVEQRAATARVLMRCYFSSVICLGFMSKLFYEEEKYWVAQNEMWNADPVYPTQAWKVVLPKIIKEQQEILDSLPEIRRSNP